MPLIEADIPAVLALDQRCLGGLWTRSGYQRELESEHSDLRVLLAANSEDNLRQRLALGDRASGSDMASSCIADGANTSSLLLLGVGCLWAILEEAHITTFAIEPAYQGKKLGQLLLTDLLMHGHKRGLTRATLEVRASNHKALKLYQKFAFQEAGQRKRYYSDGENARILWRSGLQTPDFLRQVSAQQQQAIAHLTTHQAFQIL